MGTSYWITMLSASDLADKVAAIESEQAVLLSSLGVTITYDSSVPSLQLNRTANDNPFTVGTIETSGHFKVKDGEYQIGASIASIGGYCNIICTQNSILLAFFNSLTPSTASKGWAVITKNNDNTVSLIFANPPSGSTGNNPSGFKIKETPIASSSDPILSYSGGAMAGNSTGSGQFSFASLPRISGGNVCDNAFIALSQAQTVYSGVISVNHVEYAIADVQTSSQATFFIACK